MRLLVNKPRFQVAWFTRRDLHPAPVPGYDLLQVAYPWWARLPVIVLWRDDFAFLAVALGIGALKVWWGRS